MAMRTLRAYWDAEHGWTVDTPIALTGPQLVAVISWIKKVQAPRVQQMQGDKREQAAAALKVLSPQTLKQNLLSISGHKDGERVLYGR